MNIPTTRAIMWKAMHVMPTDVVRSLGWPSAILVAAACLVVPGCRQRRAPPAAVDTMNDAGAIDLPPGIVEARAPSPAPSSSPPPPPPPRLVTHIVDGELVIEEVPAGTEDPVLAADGGPFDEGLLPSHALAGAEGDPCASVRVQMNALRPRSDASDASPALEPSKALLRTAGACRMDPGVRAGRAAILVAVAQGMQDPRERRELLEEAVDLAPTARSLWLLAEAADEMNDLRSALDSYRQGEGLSAREYKGAYRRRIEELEKKLAVEASFHQRSSQHFVARFEGDERQDLADTTLRQLDDARVRLRERLGLEPPNPITVLLYVGDQYQRIGVGPDWSGGVFDGKIRVREADIKDSRGHLEDLLFHEYVHALLHTSVSGDIPAWLNEGLAQYCEPGLERSLLEQRLKAKKRAEVPTLAQLTPGFARQRNLNVARSYYDFALDLVDEMARWRTERSFASLFESMNGGRTFAAAFEDVYGMDLALFESRWRSRYPE